MGNRVNRPYYQDDYVTIYHGDCREILPELPKVDLVLTDPPYGMNKAGWDKIINVSFIAEAYKVLKNDGVIYIWCSDDCYLPMRLEADKYFIFRRTLIWDKEVWQGGGDWQLGHEFCLYMTMSDDYFFQSPERKLTSFSSIRRGNIMGKEKSVLRAIGFNSSSNERENHPTQKPITIISKLIQASSEVNGLILDPFLGSGTTAYCAKKLNRKCIGIEIEEKYCEIAANRCRQMVMELGV